MDFPRPDIEIELFKMKSKSASKDAQVLVFLKRSLLTAPLEVLAPPKEKKENLAVDTR